jgi:hypothetical protein
MMDESLNNYAEEIEEGYAVDHRNTIYMLVISTQIQPRQRRLTTTTQKVFIMATPHHFFSHWRSIQPMVMMMMMITRR